MIMVTVLLLGAIVVQSRLCPNTVRSARTIRETDGQNLGSSPLDRAPWIEPPGYWRRRTWRDAAVSIICWTATRVRHATDARNAI